MNNNLKTIVLDLPFIYPISKKAHTRSSTKVKRPLMESIVEVQFRKGSRMLHYKESLLKESYTTVNFLQPSFFKKVNTLHQALNTVAIHNQNVTISLTRITQLAHSFWNSIYCKHTCPDICCSRRILEEGEC